MSQEHTVRLQDLKGGAVIELVNREIQNVANDIADFNKIPTSKRKVTLTLEFQPSEDAKFGSVKASVNSSLGKQIEVTSSLFFGYDNSEKCGIASENVIPSLPFGTVQTLENQD